MCKYEDDFDARSLYSALAALPMTPMLLYLGVAPPHMMHLGAQNIPGVPNGQTLPNGQNLGSTIPLAPHGVPGLLAVMGGPITPANMPHGSFPASNHMVPMYQQWPGQTPPPADQAFHGPMQSINYGAMAGNPHSAPPPHFVRSNSQALINAFPAPPREPSASTPGSSAYAPKFRPLVSLGGDLVNEDTSFRMNSLPSNRHQLESITSTSSSSTSYNTDASKLAGSLIPDVPLDSPYNKSSFSKPGLEAETYTMPPPPPPPPPDTTSNILSPMDATLLRRHLQASDTSSSKPDLTQHSSTKGSYSQVTADEYAEPGFVSVSIGQNILRIAVDDTMSSFSVASSTLLADGPLWQQQGSLSYVGMTKRDSFAKTVRNFTMDLFKNEQFQQSDPKPKEDPDLKACGSVSNALASQQVLDHDMSEDGAKIEQDSGHISITSKRLSTTGSETCAGDAHPTEPDRNTGWDSMSRVQSMLALNRSKEAYYAFVSRKVVKILPSKSAVYMAVDKFFHYVHPFVPIFHEDTALKEFKNLFEGDFMQSNEDYYEQVSIRNDAELTVTGVLLIMVQLGYMCLIPNNEMDIDYSELEISLIKDITRFKSDERIGVINMCLPEEKVKVMTTFKSVQSLTLLYFLRSVLPNDCLGLSGSDSQLLLGAIMNQALSIGMNRDPLKYETINSISKKPDFVNTWRSLWNFIVNADANNAMYCGTPVKLQNLDNSDVEPPALFSEDIASFNQKVNSISCCYRSIVTKVTNLKKKLRVIDLLSETSKLEKIFLNCFGKDFFRDYISNPAPIKLNAARDSGESEELFMKVRRFLLFINTRANLSCLYYLVVLHYEEKLDQDKNAEIGAGIELFKIFIRSVVQLVYIMSYALDNAEELFGRHYDFILTSQIERSMIKTHNFVVSFFIRLINYKRTLAIKEMEGGSQDDTKDFEERCEVVDNLFTIALIEAELFVGHFKSMSNTYINSYKLYVMASFVLKQCMENPELLLAGFTNTKQLSFFHNGTNMLQFMSNPELQDMCKLCEEFRLAKLESIRRQKNHQKAEEKKSNDKTDEKRAADGNSSTMQSVYPVDISTASQSSKASPLSAPGFSATAANRAMYGNDNTVNTYGWVKENQGQGDAQEIFDEQSMVGNSELLTLFELYGYLEN